MKKLDATPIGDVLKSIFEKIGKEKTISKEEIEAAWKELAGEAAFKHSRPASFRKNILTVRVDSSVWMQELSMKKRKLLKGLKRTLGKDRITEIHFKTGEF